MNPPYFELSGATLAERAPLLETSPRNLTRERIRKGEFLIVKNDFLKVLDKVPADKKLIGEKLVGELEFIASTLNTLKNEIQFRGVYDLTKEGDVKESALLKTYTSTAKCYGTLLKQLEFICRPEKISDGEKLLKTWLKK